MKIGSVSTELGLPASTIRYYERIGLTEAPPRVAGKREYSQKQIRELRFVKLAQSAGFSIKEIQSLSKATENRSNRWQPLVDKKLGTIRAKIDNLHRVEQILMILRRCDCPSLELCTSKTYESSCFQVE